MTIAYIDDAKDDEPGFVAARLIARLWLPEPRYTLGTPSGGVTTVGEHERLFDVAEDFGDGYCHECDVLLADCHCFDGFDFGDYDQDAPQHGYHRGSDGNVIALFGSFRDWHDKGDGNTSHYRILSDAYDARLKAHRAEAKFALYSFLIAVFGSIALVVLTAH
jgi:hypothetical protein